MSLASTETIQRHLEKKRARIDEMLERLLPSADEYPTSIHQAIRHSVFAGGKRLRPILCLEAGKLLGGDEPSLLRLGAALEMIHTYSLIHDDLPALDNDDLRRGKPTCHRAFGEATAILAGDALLTMAFEVISDPPPPPESQKLQVVRELAHAIGTCGGMVGGQVVDLEAAGQNVDGDTLRYIHSAKTGAFIRASVRSGALYAGAKESDLARLTTYGAKIGLAFQIVDDLLDVLGSEKELGKTVGKDEEQHKATYPALFGIDESKRMAQDLADQACEALEPYGGRAQTLREIAYFLVLRSS